MSLTTSSGFFRSVCISLILVSAACAPKPNYGRIGASVPLPSGPAQNACERDEWHELARARVQVLGTRPGSPAPVTVAQERVGVGVFKEDSEDPVPVKELWEGMQEPELERAHMEPIKAVKRAEKKVLTLTLVGLTGMFGGLGVAAAIEDRNSTGAAVAGISGLTIGVVSAIWALVALPSASEQMEADARSKLFLPGEDDLQAVARGVMRINSAQRQRCGGAPIPIPERPLRTRQQTPPSRAAAPAAPSDQAEASPTEAATPSATPPNAAAPPSDEGEAPPSPAPDTSTEAPLDAVPSNEAETPPVPTPDSTGVTNI